MAQGDFGVVPNVWRPQFVPPINSGEDTQTGLPGNAAANIGATTTTTTETFGSADIGWQKVFDFQAPITVSSTSYVSIRPFNMDMQTSDHLIVVTWQDPATNFSSLSIQFQDVPGANFNVGSPWGLQGTAAVANGNGLMVWRVTSMLNMINNSPSLSVPTNVNTAHHSFLAYKYVNNITAASLADNGPYALILINNNTSLGNNMPIPHSLLISPIITFDVQAKIAVGGTTSTITQITYYKLGVKSLSAQPTT